MVQERFPYNEKLFGPKISSVEDEKLFWAQNAAMAAETHLFRKDSKISVHIY